MQTAKTAVSRIEYRTNMMREDAAIIPLGYLVEACWDDVRWMGMIYRDSLTPNELRNINTETWPELETPEVFLRGLFDMAWKSDDGTGGHALSAEYGSLSSFHVYVEDEASTFANDLSVDTPDEELDAALYTRLKQFAHRLEPACGAEIVDFSAASNAGTMTKITPHKVAA